MSFILDALKKSEQERQKRTVPGLHSEHGQAEESRRGSRLWPWILSLALLLNAGILFWLQPWERGGKAPISHSADEPTVLPAPASTPLPDLPAADSPPASASVKSLKEPEPASAPVSGNKAAGSSISVPPPKKAAVKAVKASPLAEPTHRVKKSTPRLKDLSPEIRRQIPEITISLHFYTGEETSRLVRINGRNLREKQNVTDNLLLERITADGVVLNYEGHRFLVGTD